MKKKHAETWVFMPLVLPKYIEDFEYASNIPVLFAVSPAAHPLYTPKVIGKVIQHEPGASLVLKISTELSDNEFGTEILIKMLEKKLHLFSFEPNFEIILENEQYLLTSVIITMKEDKRNED